MAPKAPSSKTTFSVAVMLYQQYIHIIHERMYQYRESSEVNMDNTIQRGTRRSHPHLYYIPAMCSNREIIESIGKFLNRNFAHRLAKGSITRVT